MESIDHESVLETLKQHVNPFAAGINEAFKIFFNYFLISGTIIMKQELDILQYSGICFKTTGSPFDNIYIFVDKILIQRLDENISINIARISKDEKTNKLNDLIISFGELIKGRIEENTAGMKISISLPEIIDKNEMQIINKNYSKILAFQMYCSFGRIGINLTYNQDT